MKLRWDGRALQDLREILAYISEHGSPASAERVRRHLRSRIRLLLTNPRLGTPTSDPAIRTLLPTRYPYRIYYSVLARQIVILHIRHTARRAPDDL